MGLLRKTVPVWKFQCLSEKSRRTVLSVQWSSRSGDGRLDSVSRKGQEAELEKEREYGMNVFLSLLLAAISSTSLNAAEPLVISLQCRKAPEPTGGFRLTVENTGDDATAILLGMSLANGLWQELRELTLLVKRPQQEEMEEYQYRSRQFPAGVAGRIDHWILTLPGDSAYSMGLSPLDFFSPVRSIRLARLPSPAEVSVRLLGKPVTSDLNVDMAGVRTMRLWTGTVTSKSVKVPDDCQWRLRVPRVLIRTKETFMRLRYLVAYLLAAEFLLGMSASAQTPQGQSSVPSGPALPLAVKLSEVEMRLNRFSGGGCLGRCIRYRVVVRGDGVVEYEDFGSEPRDPSHRRTIPIDEVVALVNQFVSARFFDAPAKYERERWYQREGDSLGLLGSGGADGPTWDLTLRLGTQVKTVRLYLAFPLDLARLRDAVDQMGGPTAWTK
jgi:hypothetical protein